MSHLPVDTVTKSHMSWHLWFNWTCQSREGGRVVLLFCKRSSYFVHCLQSLLLLIGATVFERWIKYPSILVKRFYKVWTPQCLMDCGYWVVSASKNTTTVLWYFTMKRPKLYWKRTSDIKIQNPAKKVQNSHWINTLKMTVLHIYVFI